MMAQRSIFRPDQLDSNGSYSFAQLLIDGYSGGCGGDGYCMGIVLSDGYDPSTGETLSLDAHTGAINQTGTGAVNFNGNVTANGDVTLGSDSTDCITFLGSLCSNIIPCCDDAYQLGDPTHQFSDGYFVDIHIGTLNVTDLVATGDVTLGDGPEDCIKLNGVLCSDIIPCCNDAYTVGNSTYQFSDGYFVDFHVTGTLTANNVIATGDVTLGNGPEDCIKLDGVICSDIIPCCDDAYQIGDPTHTWIDAYFMMPLFDNITPVGDPNSLISVLEGIDNALETAYTPPPRGVYWITAGEASTESLDSARAADQGDTVDLTTYTDAQFRDDIYIYRNGQLLYNDPTTAASAGAVVNDVARSTADPSVLLFSANLKKCDVIQIVDMT